jgi:hypothetical protein
MQFQVPQFIEVEDKIFGPLTFKQFIYVLGGAGCAYLAYRALPIYIAVPLMLAGAGGGAALAFMQYNGRPLILAIEHGFYYLIHSKLYLWNNARSMPTISTSVSEAVLPSSAPTQYMPRLSESRLKELSWSLDIKEKIEQGTVTEDERIQATSPLQHIVAPIRTARDTLVR